MTLFGCLLLHSFISAQTEKTNRKTIEEAQTTTADLLLEINIMPVMEQVYQKKSVEWYLNQKQLWANQIEHDKTNSNAWFNYYKAARYAGSLSNELLIILQRMEEAIPGTFELHYTRYLQSNRDISKSNELLRAYILNPNRTELYKEIALYFIWTNDQENLHKILKKWKDSGDIPAALNQYARNLLSTPTTNAILITDGEYDTYPLWILQNIDKHRQDVKVLNISFMDKSNYRNEVLKNYGLNCPYSGNDKPKIIQSLLQANPSATFYFSYTTSESILRPLQSSLFNEGLAYRYSKVKDESYLLRLSKNWEQAYQLSYIDSKLVGTASILTQKLQALYQNYVASGLELYDYYQAKGEKDKASRLLVRLKKIAAYQQKESLIDQYINP